MSSPTPSEDFASACDVFKRYHLYHTEPKHPLGQLVRVADRLQSQSGRVVGYVSSTTYPAGVVVEFTEPLGICLCHPHELEAVGE